MSSVEAAEVHQGGDHQGKATEMSPSQITALITANHSIEDKVIWTLEEKEVKKEIRGLAWSTRDHILETNYERRDIRDESRGRVRERVTQNRAVSAGELNHATG